MKIITKIRKKLSFEARTIKFINDYKAYMDVVVKELKNNTVQKNEFDVAIMRIKSSLVALKNNKAVYKKTKSKVYKTLIKASIRAIRKDKKIIKSIIDKNNDYYYYHVFLNGTQKIR